LQKNFTLGKKWCILITVQKQKVPKTNMPTLLPVFKTVKNLKSVYYSNSIFGYGFSSLYLRDGADILLSLESMEHKFRLKRLEFITQQALSHKKQKHKLTS
jgi:hypothetical protein